MSWLGALLRLWDSATPTLVFWSLIAVQTLALATLPSVLLRRRGRPTVAIAWIFAVFALPLFGSLAWWTFGRTRIERKRRKRQRKKQSFQTQAGLPESSRRPTTLDLLLPFRARQESAFCSDGNELQLYSEGREAFASLERAIDAAQRSVHLLYYIFEDDETGRRIAERLMKKAREGVAVRVLLDGFGSQGGTARLRHDLKQAGVHVAIFLPSPLNPLHAPRINFTNHRKIAVFDGCVGFTGGMNIGAEYEHRWRDLMLRIEGPAVAALNHVFLEDWYFATDETVLDSDRESEGPEAHAIQLEQTGGEADDRAPSEVAVVASGPDTESWIHDAYFLAITQARDRVWIVTPYFIPTSPITMALRTAAGRGVDVRIVVPSRSDVALVKWAARSYYRPLVQAGVRIYEYQGPMLHAKALVCDHTLSATGSANIDSRSFGLSFEVACFVRDTRLNAQLSAWLEPLLADSVRVDDAWLADKSLREKLIESAAHLLSPIL